jgi:hypothetical protein
MRGHQGMHEATAGGGGECCHHQHEVVETEAAEPSLANTGAPPLKTSRLHRTPTNWSPCRRSIPVRWRWLARQRTAREGLVDGPLRNFI